MTTEEKLEDKLTKALKSIPGGYHNPTIVGEVVDVMKDLIREVVEEMLEPAGTTQDLTAELEDIPTDLSME